MKSKFTGTLTWHQTTLRSIITGMTALVLFACGVEKNEEDSEVKWGHLRYAQSAMLVNVLPNETVSLCGSFQAETRDAIEYWAQQIGRKGFLKFDLNCGAGKKINIKMISQAEMCKKYNLEPNCTVRGSAGGNTISLINGYAQNKGVVLHEVGHLWGMCDQYGNPGETANNCDRLHRSDIRSNGSSSMGASFRYELAADDIKGIKEMADRTDIRANVTWQQFLKTSPAKNPNSAAPAPTPAPAGPTTAPTAGSSYITKNADGSLTFSVSFASQKKYVEVFSTRNGQQNIASQMQESRKATGEYLYTHTASGYKAGDQVAVRIYGADSAGLQTFLPGPSATAWTPVYRY